MKLDKDALLKQRFWVALAAFCLLWLITTVLIHFSAARAGQDKRTAFENAKKTIEGDQSKSMKNATFNKQWDDYGKAFRDQKVKVWTDAWNYQADLFTWPSDDE